MFTRGSVLVMVAAGATLVNGITNGTGIARGPIVTPAPVEYACPAGCGPPDTRLCVEPKAVISGVTTRLTYLCPPPAQTVHVTETVLVTVHDTVQVPSVTPVHDSVKGPPVTPTAHTVEDTTTTTLTSESTLFVTKTLHGTPSTAVSVTSSKVLASFSVPPVVPPTVSSSQLESSHTPATTHLASTSQLDPHFVAHPSSTGSSGFILTNPLRPSLSSDVGGIWQNSTTTNPIVAATTAVPVPWNFTIHSPHLPTPTSGSFNISGPSVSTVSPASMSWSGRPQPTPIPGTPPFVPESRPQPTPIPGTPPFVPESRPQPTPIPGTPPFVLETMPPIVLPPPGRPFPTLSSSKAISTGNNSKTISTLKIDPTSTVSDLESFPVIDFTSTVSDLESFPVITSDSTVSDLESFPIITSGPTPTAGTTETFPTINTETGFISLPPESELFTSIFDGETDTAVLTDGTTISSDPAPTTAPYDIVARHDNKAGVNGTVTEVHNTTTIIETKTPTAAYPGASTEALEGVAGRFGPASTLALMLSLLVAVVMV